MLDERVWRPFPCGKFSPKSFWKALVPPFAVGPLCSLVLGNGAPPKRGGFLLVSYKMGEFSVVDNQWRWGISNLSIINQCIFCDEEPESADL